MNNYFAVLKRNQILYATSTAEFKKNVFAVKEELKALMADNAEAKAMYAQVAVELAIDLRSAIADWTLRKIMSDEEINAASDDLMKFGADNGAGEDSIAAAKAEIEAIAASATRKLSIEYFEGRLNTVWGHDYTTGLTYSMRRGARWVTTNPCKITGYRKDCRDHYDEIVAEVKRDYADASLADKTSMVIAKVAVLSAQAMRPIYNATNGEYGFVCLQVDPRNIKDTQSMIDQVHFWQKAMAKELNTENPNVVYKLPAVAASKPAAKVLIEEGYRLCMTLNFSITQHTEFAEILKKGRHQEILVEMAGKLDDTIAAELEAQGVENAKAISHCAGAAVLKKSYNMLKSKGYKNISIMTAAVRGVWHFEASMAPADGAPFMVTTTPSCTDKLDADPCEFKSVLDVPCDADCIKVLEEKSTLYKQAISEPEMGLLKEEDLYSFAPFAAFFKDFTEAYALIESDCK